MQCPECHTDNPEEAKFCLECGASLTRVCTECGTALLPRAKFCSECGALLGPGPADTRAPSDQAAVDRLQRLIPWEYAERLLATRGQVTGERRIVTILFCDVKGSSAMAEKLDPEDVMEIMDGAFDVLIAPIYHYEGTLARLMGDAILAFFGAPISHEDDPERACRAALQIVEGAKEYATKLEQERGICGFNVRVGIHTGLVVVGEVGSDLRVEYTAMGDAVNLAARMEQNAPPGAVLITHDTYRHTRGLFDVLPQEPLTLKGRSELVQAYLVERAKPHAFRLETRGVEGIETRTVGRDAELQALQNACFDAVEGSETRVALVAGDAGVGKSRLLYEFMNWAELSPEHYWLFKARARAETQAVPYAVFRDLFSNRFEILQSDSATTAMEKFRSGMTGFLEPDRADLVGHLSGFDFSSSQAVRNLLGSPSFAQLATADLVHCVRAMAAQAPVVIVLEDLHWADDSTLDLVDHVVTQVPRARLLWVCMARPALFERRPSWGEGREATIRLTLRPLSKRQSRTLVAEILQRVPAVPDDLVDLIVDGAEGNPFYIEELTKMLIEEGVIVRGDERWSVELSRLKGLRVPPTLTGVLQARLDSLPLPAREVLQRAAVIGRVFWDSAVVALSAEELRTVELGQVAPLLAAAREREFVFRRERSSFAGSQEYIFKHVILHDVTYESVLRKTRRAYHKRAAQWLEANAGERVDEYAGWIAEHYERSGEGSLAARWLQRLAEAAIQSGAGRDGIAAAERALALLPEGEKPARATLLAAMGEGHVRQGNYASARQKLNAGLALAQEAGDCSTAARATSGLSWLAYGEGDFAEAQALGTSALALARRAADPTEEARALLRLGVGTQLHFPDPELSRRYLEESLALFRQLGDDHQVAMCLNNLGEIPRAQNDYAAAARYYQESLEVRRRTGDRFGMAVTLFNLGEVAAGQGDPQASARYHQQGLDMAEDSGAQALHAVCLGGLGYAAVTTGDLGVAESHLRPALAEASAIRDRPVMLYAVVGLAALAAQRGERVRAAEWLGLALAHASSETDVQQRAQQLLSGLRAALPAPNLEAAMARGAKLELEQVVGEILQEMGKEPSSSDG